MRNSGSALARVMGALGEGDDVLPVIASIPRRIFRDRQERAERHPRDEVRRVVGEARGDVIPDDAQEIEDMGGGTLTTPTAEAEPIN